MSSFLQVVVFYAYALQVIHSSSIMQYEVSNGFTLVQVLCVASRFDVLPFKYAFYCCMWSLYDMTHLSHSRPKMGTFLFRNIIYRQNAFKAAFSPLWDVCQQL